MKDIFFSSAVMVLLLVILVMQFLTPSGSRQSTVFLPDDMRKFAAKLESEQLYAQAVEEYQRYLETAKIPSEQHANLLYKVGTLYLDELHDYENALAVFLRIQNFYPKSKVVREAEKRMIRCYEELKRGFDAQKRLEKLTDLEPATETPDGPMVAKVGNKVITLNQIENDILRMPEYLRIQYNTPEKKLEYLRTKVFQELLYDTAVRKEYQKNKEIRKQVREYEKKLMAQKVYQEEAEGKINITENDLNLYYKANQDEFSRPGSIRLAHILLETKEEADKVQQLLNAGTTFEELVKEHSTDEASKSNQGVIGSVFENNPYIPGIGREPQLIDDLMKLPEMAVSPPMQTSKGFHIFRIEEKKEKTVPPLEEVRQQVTQKVSQMRQQEFQQQFIDEMLKAEKVKIFDQVILSQKKN